MYGYPSAVSNLFFLCFWLSSSDLFKCTSGHQIYTCAPNSDILTFLSTFEGPSELEIAHQNELKIGITNELSKALKAVQRENVDTDDLAVYR